MVHLSLWYPPAHFPLPSLLSSMLYLIFQLWWRAPNSGYSVRSLSKGRVLGHLQRGCESQLCPASSVKELRRVEEAKGFQRCGVLCTSPVLPCHGKGECALSTSGLCRWAYRDYLERLMCALWSFWCRGLESELWPVGWQGGEKGAALGMNCAPP